MKIAITCQGKSLEDALDQRFGRATNILLVDTETHFIDVIDNEAMAPSGGAGIAAAQKMVDQGVTAVITGQIGPMHSGFFKLLTSNLYREFRVCKSNLEAFNKNQLSDLTICSVSFGSEVMNESCSF